MATRSRGVSSGATASSRCSLWCASRRDRPSTANLINLTTGTATFTVTRDANNSFTMLIQKMGFNVAELGNTDGIVTLQITGVQLYDPTNGMVTMTITTPLQGICQ